MGTRYRGSQYCTSCDVMIVYYHVVDCMHTQVPVYPGTQVSGYLCTRVPGYGYPGTVPAG